MSTTAAEYYTAINNVSSYVIYYKVLSVDHNARTLKIEKHYSDGHIEQDIITQEALNTLNWKEKVDYEKYRQLVGLDMNYRSDGRLQLINEKESIKVSPIYDNERCDEEIVPYPDTRREWNKLQKSFKWRFLKLCDWIDSWALGLRWRKVEEDK